MLWKAWNSNCLFLSMKLEVTNHQGPAGSFYQYTIFCVAEVGCELSAIITSGLLLIISGLNRPLLGEASGNLVFF